ncbi:hypothetical protein ILUMI_26089 [Ignelater luminosus]|uniref:SGNH hydrolase-type esterase domain-containing protein n=1 Tax=Ignelater luminosus TaxID=2038154 RepID=A0A8K0FXI3_IGNLU|nr:hypothetical protein ILUMI_26089 [Ignelater luminosus]
MTGDAGKLDNSTFSCKVPQIKSDVVGDDRWGCMHRRYVAEAKVSEAEVLFIGDSIIQQLQFSTLWTEKINSLHCVNFGIGGDRVEHVLWRVLNGELEFTVPIKVVVLFVGTNNTDCTAQNIFEGICEIVRVIKEKLGNVTVILPTLLPRGQFPNPNRVRNLEVNVLLMNHFKNGPVVSPDSNDTNKEKDLSSFHVIPIHEDIIQSDQTISHYIMYDYLHLTNQGYYKIFKPIYEKLQYLL